jgi:hypothetical protein
MSETINNGIPFVPENTIDPAAGLNLSLNDIDALLQLRVVTFGLTVPPAGVEGERHIVGVGATGDWVGQDNRMALFQDGLWRFKDAYYCAYQDALWTFDGVEWSEAGAAAVAEHVAEPDPHTQYAKTDDLGTAAYTDAVDYATSAQGAKADTALQPGDNISTLTNDAGYVDAAQSAAAAPVQSVDGKTGAVDLSGDYEQKRQNNLTATTDPTVTDDSSAGYEPLSRWINTSTGEIWLCISAATGAANWQQASLSLDELGSAALADIGTGAGQVPVTGDYDPDGSASAAQAYAIQRGNHTGTQPLSTISDAGTAAAANIGTASGEVIGTDETKSYFGLQYKPSVAHTLSSDFTKNEHKLYEQYGLEPKTILQQWDVVRASTATYVDATGKIREAGVNEPRIDYDPATGECRGLLVEEQRTNLLLWSEDFSQSDWPKSEVTIDSNVAVAPDGITTADRLYKTTSTSYRAIFQAKTIPLGFYTPSIFVKKANASEVTFAFFDNATSITLARAVYDFDTDTVTQVPTADTVDVKRELYSNGWVRLYAENVEVTNGNVRVYIYPGVYNLQTIDDDVYIWGAQLEVGSTPSSYIPTQSSQVTRAADNVVRTLGSEFNASEGTIFLNVDEIVPNSSFDFGRIYSISDGTADNRIYAIRRQSGGYSFYVFAGGVQQDDFVNLSLGDISKIAVSWKKGSQTYTYVDGILRNSGAFSEFTAQLNVAYVGSDAGSSHIGSVHSKDFRYYPRAISEAELVELTK